MSVSDKDGPFPLRQEGNSDKHVYDVTKVDVRKVAMNKVVLSITADGHTRTATWKNVRLEPRVYVQPPPDKIWEFDFVGDSAGALKEVIAPVSAEPYTWHNFPQDLVGIRVIAETNSMAKKV